MSGDSGRLDDAVAALMRKSRISTISTVLIAVALGAGLSFLSYQVYEKRQELAALNAQEADLEQQIAAKKQELAAATTAAAQTSVAAFKQQLTAAAGNATPDARAALSSVIARAQIAQIASGAGRLVYLQYADPAAAPAMKQLQAALVAQNFVAPGIEKADQKYFDPQARDEVKYFHAEDADIARTVARIATDSLSKSCAGVPAVAVPATPVPVADPAQATQLEIWVGAACGARPMIVPNSPIDVINRTVLPGRKPIPAKPVPPPR